MYQGSPGDSIAYYLFWELSFLRCFGVFVKFASRLAAHRNSIYQGCRFAHLLRLLVHPRPSHHLRATLLLEFPRRSLQCYHQCLLRVAFTNNTTMRSCLADQSSSFFFSFLKRAQIKMELYHSLSSATVEPPSYDRSERRAQSFTHRFGPPHCC